MLNEEPLRRFSRARTLAWTAGAVLFSSSSALFAWQSSVRLSARVWGHHFQRVSVESSECAVVARVSYEAPEVAYKNEDEGRNLYRFKARVRLASGKRIESREFESTGPGNHEHTFRTDTAGADCWAKKPQSPAALDVEGCRGEDCSIEPFKD